jgi:uncharacterized delta-60 repeat protein
VVGGYRRVPSQPGEFFRQFAVVRYNEDGRPDSTFGTEGKVTIQFGDFDMARSIAIQRDGKIVVAGQAGSLNEQVGAKFGVARLNADGSLDGSFGVGGRSVEAFEGFGYSSSAIYAIELDHHERLVAVGEIFNESENRSQSAVARYNPNGSLDTTFGSSGMVSIGIPSSLILGLTLAIQPDGKIVAAGEELNVSTNQGRFVLMRFEEDGNPDQTFGDAGKQFTHVGTGQAAAFDIAIQPDGKLVAVGFLVQTVFSGTTVLVTGNVIVARYDLGLANDFSISVPSEIQTFPGSNISIPITLNRRPGYTRPLTIEPLIQIPGIKPKPNRPVNTSENSVVIKLKIQKKRGSGIFFYTFKATDDAGQVRSATVIITVSLRG